MIDAHIDAMSTWEVISTLHHPDPSKCYPWAWKTAVELTYSLLSTAHIKMAPAPSIHGAGAGFQTYLTKTLGPVIALLQPQPEKRKVALRRTQEWARRNPHKLREVIDTLFADNVNFHQWLDIALSYALLEHSSRLGGLFNEEFIPYLARAFDVSETDLRLVWAKSKQPAVLKEFSRKRPDNEEFWLMARAFVLAAVIRGRFHEIIAKASDIQIIQHPMRAPAALPIKKRGNAIHAVPNTRMYLANIIVAAAFSEKTIERRIACWADNLIAVRTRSLSDDFDLHPRNDDDATRSRAVAAAKVLGVRAHSRYLETALEISWVLGVGTLTSFALHQWPSLIASLVAGAVGIRKPVGRLIAATVYERPSRLSDLATAGPGRIERVWAGTQ